MNLLVSVLVATAIMAALMGLRIVVFRSAVRQRGDSRSRTPCMTRECLGGCHSPAPGSSAVAGTDPGKLKRSAANAP